MKKLIAILITVSLICWAGMATGTTYYVSNSGNNDWDGLAPEYTSGVNGPFATIGKVNSETPTTGDIYLFKRGDSWVSEHLRIDLDVDGITYGAYGTGAKPIVHRFYSVDDPGGDDCVIQDIDIDVDNQNSRGIDIRGVRDNISFVNCDIYNAGSGGTTYQGVYFEVRDDQYPTNIVMSNCKVYDNDGHGIWAATESVTLNNCESYNNGDNNFSIGAKTGSGTAILNDCIAHGSAQQGFGISPDAGATVILKRCKSYSNGSASCNYLFHGSGTVTMNSCKSYLGHQGLHTQAGETVTVNVIHGTFYGETYASMQLGATGQHTLLNSVINSPNIGIQLNSGVGLTSDYNDIFGATHIIYHHTENSMTFAQWQAYSGGAYDQHSISADPQFEDPTSGNLRLRYDSPCIGMGDNAAIRGIPNYRDFGGRKLTDGSGNLSAKWGDVEMGAEAFDEIIMDGAE